MGFLSIAGLGLEGTTLRGGVGLAKAGLDDAGRLGHGLAREGDRIRAHVGDEADLAFVRRHAFVQALGGAHRSLRREPELAAGFLLQARGGERRRGVPVRLLGRDFRHNRMAGAKCRCVALGRSSVRDFRLLARDPDQVRLEGRAVGREKRRLEGPVLARQEGADLALAVDNQPDGDGLHAPGRKSGPNLAP